MSKKIIVKSSDCNNWNHIDCYNKNGKCKCDCHNPNLDMGIKYIRIRAAKKK